MAQIVTYQFGTNLGQKVFEIASSQLGASPGLSDTSTASRCSPLQKYLWSKHFTSVTRWIRSESIVISDTANSKGGGIVGVPRVGIVFFRESSTELSIEKQSSQTLWMCTHRSQMRRRLSSGVSLTLDGFWIAVSCARLKAFSVSA